MRKDGSVVDVSVTLSPIKDAVGAVVGASSISRDITERKRADRALREVQEGFRSAFEHAPIGMALFSVAPHDQGRLLEVNRSLSEITGYSTQQLLEMDLRDITHPDDVESERPLSRAAPLTERSPTTGSRSATCTATADPVWVTHSASTVHDSSDRLLYGVAQVEDITERKRADERARRPGRASWRCAQPSSSGRTPTSSSSPTPPPTTCPSHFGWCRATSSSSPSATRTSSTRTPTSSSTSPSTARLGCRP